LIKQQLGLEEIIHDKRKKDMLNQKSKMGCVSTLDVLLHYALLIHTPKRDRKTFRSFAWESKQKIHLDSSNALVSSRKLAAFLVDLLFSFL
jgi:hypothetical protein